MHKGEVGQVITFNGAGIGKFGDSGLDETRAKLVQMVDSFQELRDQSASANPYALEDQFKTDIGKTKYREVIDKINQYGLFDEARLAECLDWKLSGLYPPSVLEDIEPLCDALEAAMRIAKESERVKTLHSGTGNSGTGDNPGPDYVPVDQIAGCDLDYQLAVRFTAKKYGTEALSMVGGGINTVLGKSWGPGIDPEEGIGNQYDLVGMGDSLTGRLAMVANSQYHYGMNVELFIEDQPFYRGDAPSAAAISSYQNSGVKLLVDNYSENDFGDTHSLVLIIDSLSVQNVLLKLLPVDQRDTQATKDILQTILKAASHHVAVSDTGERDQGEAEGDVLENVLNALADLILGPGKENRLTGNLKSPHALRTPPQTRLVRRTLDPCLRSACHSWAVMGLMDNLG
jgi:hypothetical protein